MKQQAQLKVLFDQRVVTQTITTTSVVDKKNKNSFTSAHLLAKHCCELHELLLGVAKDDLLLGLAKVVRRLSIRRCLETARQLYNQSPKHTL